MIRQHILLVNYEYPPIGGGGAIGSAQIADGLHEMGYEITVLTSGFKNTHVEITQENGIRVIRIPVLGRNLRSSASLLSMCTFIALACLYLCVRRNQLHPTIINTHFGIPSGPVGVFAARLLRKPHVLTLIGGEIYQQPLETTGYRNPLIPLLVRWICHSATQVTAISNDTRRGAIELVRVKKPIVLTPYGFLPPSVPPGHIRHMSSRIKIVSVGRIIPRKGFDILVRALALITDLDWDLTIVGDGDIASLQALVVELKLTDRINLTGFTNRDVFWQILMNSDLFALATYHEGLGLVYHEAMYAGLPIVTTSNGGQTDFLREPYNALLVCPGDADIFAQALRQAMTDSVWFERASANNLSEIEHQSVDSIVPLWHSVFDRCTQKAESR